MLVYTNGQADRSRFDAFMMLSIQVYPCGYAPLRLQNGVASPSDGRLNRASIIRNLQIAAHPGRESTDLGTGTNFFNANHTLVADWPCCMAASLYTP